MGIKEGGGDRMGVQQEKGIKWGSNRRMGSNGDPTEESEQMVKKERKEIK